MHDNVPSSVPKQFLSFALGGLEYGLDFARVHELRVLKALERCRADGGIVDGVAVSRGVVMPLVDMRAAFGSSADAPDPLTDVIILKLSRCTMGMVVDGVTGVVTLAPDQVAPLPSAPGAQADYLIGIGRCDGRRLILVDIERLMAVKGSAPGGQSRRVA